MDQFISYEAILLPSDGRPPHCVQLMTSPVLDQRYTTVPSRLPHPEVHMDYIAEGFGAWKCILVEALNYMTKNFSRPYIVFYPVASRDGMPFPVNKNIKDYQGTHYRQEHAWRGNIVVAKYIDGPTGPFTSLTDAAMADFALLKNWFSRNGSPQSAASI